MQTYLQGNVVRVSANLAPVGFTVAGVTYRLLDHEGVEIIASAPVSGFAAGASVAQLDVPAWANTLSDGVHQAARQVELTLEEQGTSNRSVISVFYRVTRAERLIVPEVSFVTLAGAWLIAADLLQVDAWHQSTDNQRIAALLDAHERIAALRYRIYADDWQSRVSLHSHLTDSLDELTVSQWDALDREFRLALQRAQVLQAADSLSVDANATLRDQGVIEVTVGESTRVFRDSVRLRTPLCDRAMRVLGKYLETGRRLTRT